MDRWYAGDPHHYDDERKQIAEDPSGREPSNGVQPVESLGTRGLALANGLATGFGTGIGTMAAVGFAQGVVAAFSVSAAAFVAPVATVALLGWGAYELIKTDDNGVKYAGAKALGNALLNTFDPRRTASAHDLSIVGGIAGALLSGKFAKPATNLGTMAADEAVAGVKALRAPRPPPPGSDPPPPQAKVADSVTSQGKLDAVTNTPKGSRPDPASYMSADEIAAHEALFRGGAVRIGPSAPTGTIGRTETWVFPRSVVDDMVRQAGGDVAKLEVSLGLDPGYLGANPIRVDIPSPVRPRIPTGNEFGANTFWRAGGRTSGGIPEAVVDRCQPALTRLAPYSES